MELRRGSERQKEERDGLQRKKRKEKERMERRKRRRGRGMEKGEEGLCLPRRACFILGLSMVTVAVLLPLTET